MESIFSTTETIVCSTNWLVRTQASGGKKSQICLRVMLLRNGELDILIEEHPTENFKSYSFCKTLKLNFSIVENIFDVTRF